MIFKKLTIKIKKSQENKQTKIIFVKKKRLSNGKKRTCMIMRSLQVEITMDIPKVRCREKTTGSSIKSAHQWGMEIMLPIIVATAYTYTVRNFHHCCNPLYIQLETSIIVATVYTFTVETSIIVATLYTYTVRNFYHCCNPLFIYS